MNVPQVTNYLNEGHNPMTVTKRYEDAKRVWLAGPSFQTPGQESCLMSMLDRGGLDHPPGDLSELKLIGLAIPIAFNGPDREAGLAIGAQPIDVPAGAMKALADYRDYAGVPAHLIVGYADGSIYEWVMPTVIKVPFAGAVAPTATLRHTFRPGLVVRFTHERFEIVPEILS